MKLPIPNDWDGETWCEWAICWPDSELWRGILRGFLTLPQRGRTWDERTGSVVDVQITGREIAAVNLDLRRCIVACDSPELGQIATSLALIAEAISGSSSNTGLLALAESVDHLADSQCCSDLQIDVQGGIQGEIPQAEGPPVPIYGSVPPIGLPPGEFPPSYPDLEAYLADKCKKANRIFDGIIGALNNIAAFGTFNAVTLAALLAVAIPAGIIFPPAMVPVAISVLLVLSGSLFLIAQFSAALTSNRAEIICVMVESDSTEGIISLLADLVDIILAAIPATGVIGWAIKSLFLLLANADTLNALFDESLVAGYEDADCSECFGCEEQIWDFETGNNGYEVATVFPVCFELPDPGTGNVSVTGGVLTLTGVDTGDTFTAGMRKADVDHPFTIDLNLSATLRNSVATGGIYIDAVIITDTGCFWRTMSNSFNSQVFTGLGLLLNDITGNVIQEIWIYCSSAVSGTELVVEFEDLGLYCTAP